MDYDDSLVITNRQNSFKFEAPKILSIDFAI